MRIHSSSLMPLSSSDDDVTHKTSEGFNSLRPRTIDRKVKNVLWSHPQKSLLLIWLSCGDRRESKEVEDNESLPTLVPLLLHLINPFLCVDWWVRMLEVTPEWGGSPRWKRRRERGVGRNQGGKLKNNLSIYHEPVVASGSFLIPSVTIPEEQKQKQQLNKGMRRIPECDCWTCGSFFLLNPRLLPYNSQLKQRCPPWPDKEATSQ